MKWAPSLPALAIATALLAGCVTAPSERIVLKPVCPHLAEYPADFQARAADALDALPAGSPLAQMVEDYGALRDQVRACRKSTS